MFLKRFAIILVIIVLAIFTGGSYYLNYSLDVDINSEEKEVQIDRDNRYQVGPVEVLKVEGSPYEMGYQQGNLMAEEIDELIGLMYEEALELEEESIHRRIMARFYIRRAALSYFNQMPDRFRKELQGVADGSGLSLYDILLINVYDELFNLEGCTNIAVWGKDSNDQELLVGRNLDYYYPQIMYDKQVLTYFIPEDGNQFISADFPGYIGVLTGLNEKGLSIGSLTAQAEDISINGIPTGILYRMIMESAISIDDTEEILNNNPRTIGNNLLVADADSREASVMEISPAKIYRRESSAEKNYIAVANHFNELKNDVLHKSSVFRQDRAEELLGKYLGHDNDSSEQKLSRKDIINILNDQEEIEIEGYGFYSIGNQRNIQSAVIKPEKLKLWLSINQSLPAASQNFYGFKLQPEEQNILILSEHYADK